MKKFYVYIYFDPRKTGRFVYGKYTFDYEPFYVGKGCSPKRKFDHLRTNAKNYKNTYIRNKILKLNRLNLKPIIVVYKDNLLEVAAFKLEKKLIKFIGRGRNGPLSNLTDGGEGGSGRLVSSTIRNLISRQTKERLKSKTYRESWRKAVGDAVRKANRKRFTADYCEKLGKKVSDSLCLKWKDPVFRKKMMNRPKRSKSYCLERRRLAIAFWKNPAYRAAIICGNTGRKPTVETRNKIRAAMLGRKIPISWRNKIRKKLKGFKHSLLSRKNMSIGQRRRGVRERRERRARMRFKSF